MKTKELSLAAKFKFIEVYFEQNLHLLNVIELPILENIDSLITSTR
jgi:hypothetical protein